MKQILLEKIQRLIILYITTSNVYIEENNKWDIVISLECKDRFDSKATYVSNITFKNKDLIKKTDTQLEYKVNNDVYVISNNDYHICLCYSIDNNEACCFKFVKLDYKALATIPNNDVLNILNRITVFYKGRCN